MIVGLPHPFRVMYSVVAKLKTNFNHYHYMNWTNLDKVTYLTGNLVDIFLFFV